MLAVIGYLICISLPRKSFAEILQVIVIAVFTTEVKQPSVALTVLSCSLLHTTHMSFVGNFPETICMSC
jgi:hypothetical protein